MRILSQSFALGFFACVSSVLGTAASDANEWPSQTIKLVVPFPAGGMLDVVGRPLARHLADTLGQPVVVENRPGAGGLTASAAVAKSAPDGHTLLVSAIGPAVIAPLLNGTQDFDPSTDLVPIILVADSPNLLVTSTQRTFKTVGDVVTYARQNPGKLTIGHPGVGTMGHLVALVFTKEAGIDASLVAYPGTSKMIPELLGGHIDVASLAYGPGTDATTVLAVTMDQRASFLPDIPTMGESHLPNVTGSTWLGIFAPRELPTHIVAKINAATNDFLAKEETKAQLNMIGLRVLGGSPERLKTQMENDRIKWSKIIATEHVGGK